MMRHGVLTIAILSMSFGLSACSGPDESNIVVATESAITISTSRIDDPIDIARAHCAKYGRQVVSRGGVKMGDPAYKIMWGYDCVKPGGK